LQEAARHGMKVVLFDFVKPTPHNTTWGLGGTCVNVGCIPKKLMHKAAIMGEDFKDAPFFGWNIQNGKILLYLFGLYGGNSRQSVWYTSNCKENVSLKHLVAISLTR
jgi:hypothetical protein